MQVLVVLVVVRFSLLARSGMPVKVHVGVGVGVGRRMGVGGSGMEAAARRLDPRDGVGGGNRHVRAEARHCARSLSTRCCLWRRGGLESWGR